MTDFAARLRRLREGRGITPYRLAQLSGLTRQAVMNLEVPGVDPKLSTLHKLAKALDVDVCELVSEKRMRKSKAAGQGAANTRPA